MTNHYIARMQEYAAQTEAELARWLSDANTPYQEVLDAMAHSALGGGKRIRAVLVLSFYGLFARDARALPLAAAMEMVHAYSLIHDDLPCMDDAETRRGKPACHIAFGQSTALLAGDALLTLAFEAAASADFPPAYLVEAIRALSRAAGPHGMVAGQVMDLAAEGKTLSAAGLDAINDRKTGALFRAAAGIGCILGGASPEQAKLAQEYAAGVGRAFQIIDDILDVTADPAKLGKPVGTDAQNKKNTYAAIYGVARCRELVAEQNAAAKKALAQMGADTSFLAWLADELAGREF